MINEDKKKNFFIIVFFFFFRLWRYCSINILWTR
jgi:hypothetical protein